ncbi:UNVERIFIED_CONTAM: hypothetical protein GTU68_018728 [Idotea baltica]|nr:hypothetical protein [Idotea baltica]
MRAPDFWHRPADKPGFLPRLLSPLGALYAKATAQRISQPGYTAQVPIICVGNLNAGGTGKTPTVIFLIQMLQDRGVTPHVVSRGYGGKLEGPLQVEPLAHAASDVGDEPLLVSAFAPVWVSKDRKQGVKAAENAGAKVILLDDGFQNPSVQKDLSLIVVDAKIGFGNGRTIPAGPLREPVPAGMRRADMILSIGDETAQSMFLENWGKEITKTHLVGQLLPLETGMSWTDTPFLAFAGIGHPEKFFLTLKNLGANLVRAEALSDHQELTQGLLRRLEADATQLGAQLVTTEKDAVRLPSDFRHKVITLPVRLDIANASELTQALEKLGF